MFDHLRKMLGKEPPMPTGKTGNQWTSEDVAAGVSPLVKDLAFEYADFCISKQSCDLDGEVLDKFKDIIKRFPAEEDDDSERDDDYDPQEQFAVLVRDRLIDAGLLAKGDPNRYQYKISMGFIHFSGE